MTGLNKILLLIFLTLLSLTSFKTTLGFFSDNETASENILTAASSFASPSIAPSPSASISPSVFPTSSPTPTPSPLANYVVINEVNYKVDSSHTIVSEENSEWLELYNPTALPVVLTGWSITDNNSCDNFQGSITLASNSFAIVTPLTETSFESVWSGVPSGTIYITLSSSIGNGLANNDRLQLKNSSCSTGTIIDQISWGNDSTAFNPGIGIVADGHSSERNPDGIDTDTATDFVDRSVPTPGN
jgi:uncharacterized protein